MQINDEILYQALTFDQEKTIIDLTINYKTLNYVLGIVKKKRIFSNGRCKNVKQNWN